MRKALIVGIDNYQYLSNLSGCVNDAYNMNQVLERNFDGTTNFVTPKLLISSGLNSEITKGILKDATKDLFSGNSDIALFYFAGHGHIEETGGYLLTQECQNGDEGFPISDLISLANNSKAKNKIIVLDSCYSGAVAARIGTADISEVKEGMTILTASTADQYAAESENGGSGVFTNLLVDALNGAAANLVGDVTPGGIYAHIDQSLGPWAQRPVFKTNVESFVSLRKVSPPIELDLLQRLPVHFPGFETELSLDPSFEPERSAEQAADKNIPPPNIVNTKMFEELQKYVKVNLVKPVGATHMYHAAMGGKSCKLTILGEHYRDLAKKSYCEHLFGECKYILL